ncbi:hypothetical protein Pcinc_001499 [Petrolisthes cinctipes]|uniref:Uncharacterized protein n=1 Tax=Petrolisthes cinctipes TaxID=88211 RepID=A0AAE1GLI7_PETCI|nr:hypothetical protein Pcinc_001499 [Petrolisthes cinctipes]
MAKTHSRFNSKRLRSVGERKLFREVLICHHGVKHKGVKKTYTGCQVHMDVTIRTGSKNSLYSDKLMKEYPCFIIIKGNHNHPTASAEALNQLPVSPTTRMMFEKYFEQGLTTAQASRHHIWKMDLSCAVTRSQTKLTQSPSFLPSLNPPSFVPEDLINTTLSKKELITAQKRDPSLA